MRYLSMILCVCLLIAAVIIMPEEQEWIGIGRGNGKDDVITTVREVGDFLAFVMGEEYEESLELSNDNVMLLSSTDTVTEEIEDKSEKIRREYTSGSIHEDCYLEYVYIDETSNDRYEYSLIRTLSLYMTEDASYYRSKGTRTNIDKTESTRFVFDMEFYFDSDITLCKFNTFEITGNLGFKVSDDIVGKWFKAEDIADIDGMNRDVLGEIGVIILTAEDDKFEEYKKNIFIVDPELTNGAQVKIDLRNSENPMMDIQYSDNSDDGMTVANVVYSFENINNTVVKLDPNIEIHTNIDKYFKEVK